MLLRRVRELLLCLLRLIIGFISIMFYKGYLIKVSMVVRFSLWELLGFCRKGLCLWGIKCLGYSWKLMVHTLLKSKIKYAVILTY